MGGENKVTKHETSTHRLTTYHQSDGATHVVENKETGRTTATAITDHDGKAVHSQIKPGKRK